VATIGSIVYFAIAKIIGFDFPNSFFFIVGMTTLTWVIATFLTNPTADETLIAFVKKVKPDGIWSSIYRKAGIEESGNSLGWMFIAWGLAVVFTYSILFLSGKVVLAEYQNILPLAAVAFISLVGLNFTIRKIKLFSD
jgi:hypothetical protein